MSPRILSIDNHPLQSRNLVAAVQTKYNVSPSDIGPSMHTGMQVSCCSLLSPLLPPCCGGYFLFFTSKVIRKQKHQKRRIFRFSVKNRMHCIYCNPLTEMWNYIEKLNWALFPSFFCFRNRIRSCRIPG